MSHSSYQNAQELQGSVLGQSTAYASSYDPSLLFAIPRSLNRDQLGLVAEQLPFDGVDIWTGYELSWLNPKGKPMVAVAEFRFPATSSHIIESKSFKLYLNSFNQHPFTDFEQVQRVLQQDLSQAACADVTVTLYQATDLSVVQCSPLPGDCLDDLDITIDQYQPNAQLLQIDNAAPSQHYCVNSHLLKSNCLITSQPDWASVVIRYVGPKIVPESLLQYLVSFRSHNEFHEQCVERIFCDLNQLADFTELDVYARYTRRGGLDINPYRSKTGCLPPWSCRTNRQ